MRALGALELWKAGKIKKIFIAGGIRAVESGPTVSEVMKEYLVKHGVPDDDIIIDTKSKNTTQNLENIIPLTEGQGIGKFLLLTNEYHSARGEQRAQHELKKRGRDFDPNLSVTAEELLRERSRHYEDLVEHYEFPTSLGKAPGAAIVKGVHEFARRGLYYFDPEDKKITSLADKLRR